MQAVGATRLALRQARERWLGTVIRIQRELRTLTTHTLEIRSAAKATRRGLRVAFQPGTFAIRPAAVLNETDFIGDDIVVLESFTVTSSLTNVVAVTPALRQHVLLLDVTGNDPIVHDRPQVALTSISNLLFGKLDGSSWIG